MSVGLVTRGYVGQGSPGGGVGDTTPPTITIVSPTPDVDPGDPGGFSLDWQTARFTPIVLDIQDATPGNRYQCLVARYPGALDEITVYRRGAFRGSFVGLSTSSAVSHGIRLTILPINGWPSSDALNDVVFDVDAIDQVGNLAS